MIDTEQQTAVHTSLPATGGKLWTFSNMLSASRMVLALPAALALSAGMRWTTFWLCIAATLTDILDGYFARRNNEISDIGKIIDPLADKVFVAVLVVFLLMQNELPLWFVIVVLGRDVLILLGGIVVERRTGQVLPSNYPGKVAVLSLALLLLLVIVDVEGVVITVLMGVSLVLLGISLFLYGRRAVKQSMKDEL